MMMNNHNNSSRTAAKTTRRSSSSSYWWFMISTIFLLLLLLLNLFLLTRTTTLQQQLQQQQQQQKTGLLLVSDFTSDKKKKKKKSSDRSSSRRSTTTTTSSSTFSSSSEPDAMLNSYYPLYYYNNTSLLHSHVHCVGEGFELRHNWIHRSCRFRHLCLDLSTREYVLLVPSDAERDLQRALNDESANHENIHVPSTMLSSSSNNNNNSHHVSIGGINTKWTWKKGVPRLQWFPSVLDKPLSSDGGGGVYLLPDNVVWVPFHSMAGFNPGHLVWDDFLPIYTLLSMFQLLPTSHQNNFSLLLTRYILPGDRLWASCETREENTKLCNAMFRKFLPLMGIQHHDGMSTNRNVSVVDFVSKEGRRRSNYVCAKHAVAGLGMLTDHGIKLHGWEEKDFEYTHNHGRGGVLFQFRNWMMENLMSDDDEVSLPFRDKVKTEPPYRITFSVSSSRLPGRSLDFTKQIQALETAFPKDILIVQTVKLSELSMVEQIRIASESSIFVSVCGGGAVTATFLPQGASVFLFFLHNGGVKNNKRTGQPARLDWDLFNNAAYLRTHWLPKSSMDDAKSLELFVQLVKHELDIISHMM